MINIISWIGTFGSIISNFLVAKKVKFAPKLWTLATGLLLIAAIYKKDWSNIFLFLVYELLNIYMWIEWNKNSNEGSII
jgi:hypothetical protein